MDSDRTDARGARASSARTEGLKGAGRGLGNRIMRLRCRKGWDRASLAEGLGVSPDRLKKWELGKYRPSVRQLVALARTLGVTIDELVTGQAAPTPELSPRQQDEAKLYLAGLMRLLKLRQGS
jgi:transcriptional regulator with XRE-family HTH domain